MKTTITAVIFDMDGVLFDTERMYMECWREAAEPRGLKNVDEISKACIGRTLQGTKEVFEAAKAEQGIDVSFEELHEDCSRRFQKKEEREGLPEKPGVHEILEYLKENEVPVALASSTRKAAVMEHLNRAGITGYFQKIVCGDMVDHGKPAPDIYVKACEEMGVKPEQAMAVEDSFNGIRSAHAAGLFTVMVPDQLPPTEEILTIVDKKCDSLTELQTQLPELLAVCGDWGSFCCGMEPQYLTAVTGGIPSDHMICVSRYHKGGTGQQRDFFAIDESISFSVQYEEAFLIVMLLRHVIFCVAIEGYAHTTPFYTPLVFI